MKNQSRLAFPARLRYTDLLKQNSYRIPAAIAGVQSTEQSTFMNVGALRQQRMSANEDNLCT